MSNVFRLGFVDWPIGMMDRPPHKSWYEYRSPTCSAAPNSPVGFSVFGDHDEERTTDELPDVAWARPGALAISERAMLAFKSLNLSTISRIFPIDAKGEASYSLVVPQVAKDVVDYENSDVRRFKSSGRIKKVTQWHFYPQKEFPAIFRAKLENKASTDLFVNLEFWKIVEDHGLTGIKKLPVNLTPG